METGDLSILQNLGSPRGALQIPPTSLPRISCRTWWRWCTSCAFPLQKGAHAALSSAAWQEIRVRSGRDDKGEGLLVGVKFAMGMESNDNQAGQSREGRLNT
jgi:hypothetical protein